MSVKLQLQDWSVEGLPVCRCAHVTPRLGADHSLVSSSARWTALRLCGSSVVQQLCLEPQSHEYEGASAGGWLRPDGRGRAGSWRARGLTVHSCNIQNLQHHEDQDASDWTEGDDL
ncbi:unnamed protein product [Pleuronectes platessa]|uniref:Uncharacterized protein n=1 Tax=Pleuronectes platessa TaxID=8262 RepID=A0A9N7VTE3_PLEPL|nr:unnamed protein product [Pleuronectes platessa]